MMITLFIISSTLLKRKLKFNLKSKFTGGIEDVYYFHKKKKKKK